MAAPNNAQIPHTYHLLHLLPTITPSHFLSLIKTQLAKHQHPLLAGTACKWVVPPAHLTTTPLLTTPWDMVILLPSSATASVFSEASSLTASSVLERVAIELSIPASTVTEFPAKNESFLHPATDQIPELPKEWTKGNVPDEVIVSDAHAAEEMREVGTVPISRNLATWANEHSAKMPNGSGKGPVSMLNLLAFNGEEGKGRYFQYIQAFSEGIGSKRGGAPKVLGDVEGWDGGKNAKGWDMHGLIHYPSLWHFLEMVASREYLEVEKRFKNGALRDTCILCVCELDI